MRSRGASEFSKLQMAQHALAFLLGLVLLFAACPRSLVAQDQAASAQAPSGPPIPYLGYFFRILVRQGRHAPDGAKSCLLDGKMVTKICSWPILCNQGIRMGTALVRMTASGNRRP